MEPRNGSGLESETDVVQTPNVTNLANPNKADEDIDSSTKEANQSSDSVDDLKNQASVKVKIKQSTSKNTKVSKNGPNTSTFGRTPRPSLSQSSSFPAKTETPVGPTLSMSSSSRSHPANNKPEISSSGLKPIKTRVAVKESDAASSTASPIATSTPSGPRRNSTSAMQVKSKEIDDKDIKKFRKSLTFKATPMPNFYKEPPPKPQLKKIPTTRAISPKLGRTKSNVTISSKQIENFDSPRAAKDQTVSPRFKYRDATTSKKPIRKSSLTKTSSEVKVGKSKDKEEVNVDGPLKIAGYVDVDTVQESGFKSGSGSPNQDMTRSDIIV